MERGEYPMAFQTPISVLSSSTMRVKLVKQERVATR